MEGKNEGRAGFNKVPCSKSWAQFHGAELGLVKVTSFLDQAWGKAARS